MAIHEDQRGKQESGRRFIAPRGDVTLSAPEEVQEYGIRFLPLDRLSYTAGTQARVVPAPEEYIQELRAAFAAGKDLGPVEVILTSDGEWILWDGFSRTTAAKRLGRGEIKARVQAGTVEDAVWLAASANKSHGLRRTNEDKANAVRMALRSPKAAGMSDNQIADHVGVDAKTVAKYRAALSMDNPEIAAPQRMATRGGKTYPINVEKIGKRPAEPKDPKPATPKAPHVPPAPSGRSVYVQEPPQAVQAVQDAPDPAEPTSGTSVPVAEPVGAEEESDLHILRWVSQDIVDVLHRVPDLERLGARPAVVYAARVALRDLREEIQDLIRTSSGWAE
jgi:hypothetical protein